MPESAPSPPQMYPEPKRGIWHGAEFDRSVVIVGTYGLHEDNREYLIAEGGVGVPKDEFEEEKPPQPDPNGVLKVLITLAIKRVLR